jgi:hypothetical protein
MKFSLTYFAVIFCGLYSICLAWGDYDTLKVHQSLGVGTSAPLYKLHVDSGTAFFRSLSYDIPVVTLRAKSTSFASSILNLESQRTSNLNDFYFIKGISDATGSPTTRFIVTGGGCVGVGYSSPGTAALAVNGSAGIGTASPNLGNYNTALTIRDSSTNSIAALEISGHNSSSNTLASIDFINRAYDSNAVLAGICVSSLASDHLGSTVVMLTGRTNGTLDTFVVVKEGRMGIGVNDPTSALAVNGKISCKEIKVQTTPADFVFAVDYCLRPLAEVEKFVKTNKHLPEIPSAKDQAKYGGTDMGAMQSKLLQKVEELTLYMIDLKKENETLKTRITVLEQK